MNLGEDLQTSAGATAFWKYNKHSALLDSRSKDRLPLKSQCLHTVCLVLLSPNGYADATNNQLVALSGRMLVEHFKGEPILRFDRSKTPTHTHHTHTPPCLGAAQDVSCGGESKTGAVNKRHELNTDFIVLYCSNFASDFLSLTWHKIVFRVSHKLSQSSFDFVWLYRRRKNKPVPFSMVVSHYVFKYTSNYVICINSDNSKVQ